MIFGSTVSVIVIPSEVYSTGKETGDISDLTVHLASFFHRMAETRTDAT